MLEYRNLVRTFSGDIDGEINHPDYGWIPYTFSANDVDATAQERFAVLQQHINDGLAVIPPYAPPDAPSEEEVAAVVRTQRLMLLEELDWTQLTDVPEDTRLSYQTYRQALRDIPQQETFPWLVTWPTPPIN